MLSSLFGVSDLRQLILPRAEAERRGRLDRMDAAARFDALDKMLLSGIVCRGVDEVDSRLIERHGVG